MNRIIGIVAVFLCCLVVFIGCLSVEFKPPLEIQHEALYNASWTQNENVIKKAVIGDRIAVSAFADASKVPDGTGVFVRIFCKNPQFDRLLDDTGGLITEIRTSVKQSRVNAEFLLMDFPELSDQIEYVVPRYSFKITADNGYEIAESPQLSVYAMIKTQLVDADTGRVLYNRPYLVQKPSGEIVTRGKSDNNGFVEVRWLGFGQYYINAVDTGL